MLRTRDWLTAAIVCGFALVVSGSPATGGSADEATLEVLVNSIRSNRAALVAVNLGLNDDEAAKFWPVFDRYQQAANATSDRLVVVIEEYSANFSDLSDERAVKLTTDYLAVEADWIKLRQTYIDEFAKALPGRKLARFYQIENKMDAVVRYDLAAVIPVVEDPSTAND